MAMSEDFEAAVEDGLRLSRRIYFGKDRAVAPPKPPSAMERSAGRSLIPTSPMLYAVISDPAIVDNPDMPSYQPHVHGKCDRPALIPLQMSRISVEVDCHLDTAFITLNGSWRVHCVMGSRSCDCRIALPMGEQGSILGVEVDVPRKSYSTQLSAMENENGKEKKAKIEHGAFLKPHIFTLTVPKIDGGTNISIKLRWSQKLLYHDGQFTVNVPFVFPDYVVSAGMKIAKHEKIRVDINPGPGTEILSKSFSHPLKERRKGESSYFLYEADVLNWSTNNFEFTYAISTNDNFGNVLLNPQASNDADGREMFCCYLYPGKKHSEKAFRREVVFAVDISESVKGKVLEDTKNALFAALAKLDPHDSFNIIAFNSKSCLYSSSLVPATEANTKYATKWITMNFIAGGGTDIMLPLNQGVEMFSDSPNSFPFIFLMTDGSVGDERNICDIMANKLTQSKYVSPRIYTLAIGMYCNQYFLRRLATLSRGHHEAANDVDTIEVRFERLFARALSIILANIAFENLDEIEDLEVFPSQIPDLSSASTLMVSGRYRGKLPETVKLKGVLPDMSNISVDLKVRDPEEEVPVAKIIAKPEIELLTAEAWYSNDEEVEQKISKLSIQHSILSEYSQVILLETEKAKPIKKSALKNNTKKATSKVIQQEPEPPKPRKIRTLQDTGLGFGNLIATAENIPPGSPELPKPPEPAEVIVKATTGCCGRLCEHCCCCLCCLSFCTRLNNACGVLLTQICGAIVCTGCYACCVSCCCSGQNG